MLVFVFVGLGQMQPDATAHERYRNPKQPARAVTEHRQRNNGPNERRCRKISTGARGAEIAQGQHKQH